MILRSRIYTSGGYAELGRLLLQGLVSCGEKVSLIPLDSDQGTVLSEEQHTLIEECKSNPPTDPVLQVCTPPEYDFSFSRSWGVSLFEAFVMPDSWLLAMNRMDKIITFSDFNKHLFSRQGFPNDKIVVIPPAVDLNRFSLEISPLYCSGLSEFVILFVGQLILRKGWDILLEAACREFRKGEGVCILLKIPPQPSLDKVRALLHTFGRNRPPVLVSQQNLLSTNIPQLYQCTRKLAGGKFYPNIRGTVAGCMAIPSLGEGVALPYLEAMASGCLVIGTGVTGQAVYLDASCAVIVPTPGQRRRRDLEVEQALYRGAPFLDVSVEAVRAALRRAYELSPEERERLTHAARTRAEGYTPHASAQEILDNL